MILGDPWFLALVVPLAVLVAWCLARPGRGVDGGSQQTLAGLPSTWRQRTAWLPAALLTAAVLLVMAALARPLRGREETRVLTEGIDIMLVVDTSSSMLDTGLESGLTNLEVVKEVVASFVQGRETDRLGLLTFANYPSTACPLTLDRDAMIEHLQQVQSVRPRSEEDGTAIGVALGTAVAKLRDSDAKSKVVVLLTDGEENAWTVDPLQAAALAKDLDIRVYTIGVVRKVRTFFGGMAEQPVDTRLLQAIASDTGGRFFGARDAAALREIYAEIDRMEKTRRQDIRYTDYEDLYRNLLAPAVMLLALGLGLGRSVYLEFAS